MTPETRMEAIMVRLELDVDWDTDYRLQGMDSLDFVELIVECEREFDIILPNEEVHQCFKIHDLLEVIKSKLPKV
jgi:acyl carrier protein